MFRIVPAVLIALSLAGCATMSPEECRFANWGDVGQRDGLAGKSLALLNTRVGDCAENNVRVDTAAYLKGRETGLQSFCRLDNAVQLGLHGGSYEGVCPAHIDAQFRHGFLLGYQVYATHAEVGRIDNRIQSLEQRLRMLERDEDHRLREADQDDERRRIRRESDDQRRHIRGELRDLDRQLHRARDAMRDAEWQLDRLR